MIPDIVGAVYLLWPVTIAGAVLFFIAGFVFALSIGGFLAVGLLLAYYVYIYAKKKGFVDSMLDWVQKKNRLVGSHLVHNIQETFILKGNLSEIPDGPVLYIAHPHGLFSMAPFLHWASGVTQWPSEKKVHMAIHSVFFSIPIVREVCESFGVVEATDSEIRAVLEKGESVALLTGGVQEISLYEPGKMILNLRKRKGFARIAKELNVPIVPVLTFGENELFPPVTGFWTQKVQLYLRNLVGIALPLPTWKSVKNWFGLLRGPLPASVVTWVGKPIPTKNIHVDTIRKHVFVGFEELYREGRPEGFPLGITIL